ncbi:MAG TPA: methyltransferase domain-containing protein [Mycobacteriales bacterium]|nr:methyltransferase domain-containing protein [Mycobacteriales bacterium]
MSAAVYALERTPREYERLRAQARMWEPATARVLDRVGLAPGASCLDAGCGPGETMRLLARRVGPGGTVTGIDVDAGLGALAEAGLHADGLPQCRFVAADLTAAGPVPGGPYDLVFARLLLFHLPQRVSVLSRLWAAVRPGGHLVVQDYDLGSADVLPAAASATETVRLLVATFEALGCDVRAGLRLPLLFAAAGVGAPDDTDVAGRVEPFATGQAMLAGTLRSVLPAAYAHGICSEGHAEDTIAALHRDAAGSERALLWPLMAAAWRRRPA